MNVTPKNAVGYCRLSQNDKDNPSQSLQTQRELITSYCQRNNLVLLEIYDEGIEQSFDWNRKEFNRLQADALQKKFEIVCCKDETRLSRDMSQLMSFIKDCKALSIQVWSISTEEELTGNELMTGFKAVMAEDVIIRGRYNQSKMVERKTAAGIPWSKAPYGYRNITNGWTFQQSQRITVQQIFTAFINGINLSQLSREFGKPINTIRHILKNKAYTGTFEVTLKKFGSKSKLLGTEKINYPIPCGAIIDQETYDIVQRKFVAQHKPTPEEVRQYYQENKAIIS